jgi:hypothetical protein
MIEDGRFQHNDIVPSEDSGATAEVGFENPAIPPLKQVGVLYTASHFLKGLLLAAPHLFETKDPEARRLEHERWEKAQELLKNDTLTSWEIEQRLGIKNPDLPTAK